MTYAQERVVKAIRGAIYELDTPDSREEALAKTKLEEALMWYQAHIERSETKLLGD